MGNENVTKTPWKNGYYRMKGMPSFIGIVQGENVLFEGLSGKATNHEDNPMSKGTWKFGDFGEAVAEVAKEAGKKNANIEINCWGGLLAGKGILSDDGKKVTFWGISNAVDFFEWESEESINALKNSGDPVDAPPSHHKVQPENQGQFLFISGAPGLGKSTTGHVLGKKFGYVYYEGDCFFSHANPYIPPEAEEPTLASLKQNFLKGVSQERIDATGYAETEFMTMLDGGEYDMEKICRCYSAMAKDILSERKRLGGDWAIAQAVPTRALREHLRSEMGPELIFVVLHMTKEDQQKRIKARHGDEEEGKSFTDMLLKSYEIYETAAENEPNTLEVIITPEMSPDDVVDKLLHMLKARGQQAKSANTNDKTPSKLCSTL